MLAHSDGSGRRELQLLLISQSAPLLTKVSRGDLQRLNNNTILSEIETLTGEDTTERVEMALGQPITSGEQSPERKLQERKLQNNVIIAS